MSDGVESHRCLSLGNTCSHQKVLDEEVTEARQQSILVRDEQRGQSSEEHLTVLKAHRWRCS